MYILLSVVSCKGKPIGDDKIFDEKISQNENEAGDTIKVSMGNTQLTLYGLYEEDFTYEVKKDTIYLIKNFLVGIDNLQIQILSDANNQKLTGEITYGVSQYLLDDMIPPRLNFTYKESIQIPMVSGKYDLSKVIKSLKELQSIYQNEHFNELRKESYQFQKTFYQKEVLNKKEKYKDCCPEYIQKAKDFLLKKEKEFNSIDELYLEPGYKKIIIYLGNNKYMQFQND
jgi:hypothetical protein